MDKNTLLLLSFVAVGKKHCLRPISAGPLQHHTNGRGGEANGRGWKSDASRCCKNTRCGVKKQEMRLRLCLNRHLCTVQESKMLQWIVWSSTWIEWESCVAQSNGKRLTVAQLAHCVKSGLDGDNGSKMCQHRCCWCCWWWRLLQHTKEKLLVLIEPAALQWPGDKPRARAQQRARGEVKAQTIRYSSEASILLQRQSAADSVSRSAVLGCGLKKKQPFLTASGETSWAGGRSYSGWSPGMTGVLRGVLKVWLRPRAERIDPKSWPVLPSVGRNWKRPCIM